MFQTWMEMVVHYADGSKGYEYSVPLVAIFTEPEPTQFKILVKNLSTSPIDIQHHMVRSYVVGIETVAETPYSYMSPLLLLIGTVSLVLGFGAFFLPQRRLKAVVRRPPIIPRIPEVKTPPLEGLMPFDERVYLYIVDHGGEISWSQASRDLAVSIEELKASVERLKQAKRIIS